jgi:hypothetical protein
MRSVFRTGEMLNAKSSITSSKEPTGRICPKCGHDEMFHSRWTATCIVTERVYWFERLGFLGLFGKRVKRLGSRICWCTFSTEEIQANAGEA